MQKGSEKVHLVVRTVNSAAFSSHDWEEYVVAVSPHPILNTPSTITAILSPLSMARFLACADK